MQERPAPTAAAMRGTGTAALLLVFCCAPAFAAIVDADALCAQSISPHISFDIPVDELSLTMVDLGVSAAVTTAHQAADYDVEPALQPPSVATAPRVERILREIFDESLPADHEAADATPSSSPNAATLAELTAPGLREMSRDVDGIDTDAARIREVEQDVTEIITRVPGVSEDELARYRRQMFRTDI